MDGTGRCGGWTGLGGRCGGGRDREGVAADGKHGGGWDKAANGRRDGWRCPKKNRKGVVYSDKAVRDCGCGLSWAVL